MRSIVSPLFVRSMRTSDGRGAMKAGKGDELQDKARLAKIPDEGFQGLI